MVIKYIQQYKKYLLLALADLLFFGFCNPNSNSWLLLPAFGLLIATIYVVLKLLLKIITQFIAISPLLRKKMTVFGTFVLGVVIALQSLGQLTPRDIITVVPLI